MYRGHFARIRRPIVAAPMAGGVSTTALAAAVCNAGGFGFLAGGYKSARAVREEIAELRSMTGAPFGVNLFVPGPQNTDAAGLDSYRAELEPEAERYGVALKPPPAHDDDEFEEKLAVLLAERVPVASFTFGCPPAIAIDWLHAAGIEAVVTVTSVAEAASAARSGADVLCVQGSEAGGHRGGFAELPAEDAHIGLLPLTAMIRETVALPLIAAGGIADGYGVAAALAAGAMAAQLGTAFLRTPESGAHPLHKAALVDPEIPGTSVTCAFTGRPARGLTNRFIIEHGGPVPACYPQIHHLTKPLRQAAAAANDRGGMALWAGQGHRCALDLPAARLVERLADQAAQALAIASRRLHGDLG